MADQTTSVADKRVVVDAGGEGGTPGVRGFGCDLLGIDPTDANSSITSLSGMCGNATITDGHFTSTDGKKGTLTFTGTTPNAAGMSCTTTTTASMTKLPVGT